MFAPLLSSRRFRTYAVLISLLFVLFEAVVWFVVRPLHSAGIAQDLLWPINALGHMVDLPGLGLLHLLFGEFHLGKTPGGPYLLLILNFGIFFGGLMALRYAYLNLRRQSIAEQAHEPEDGASAEAQAIAGAPAISRRSFLGIVSTGAASVAASGGVGGLAAYSLFYEPHRVPVTRTSLKIAGLPESMNGLRIVQLTDLHLGPWISREFVRSVVDRANRLEPDLIALTGDYVHQSPDYIWPVAAELGRLRAKGGVAAVLGNHDWWESAELFREHFDRFGIPLIDNNRLILTPERRLERSAREGLCIAGVGDLWEDDIKFSSALGGVPDAMPRVVLSHNPDVAEMTELAGGSYRADLLLAGHTHGGQVGFPVVGTPVIPSRYGQKYARGLVQGPACPVYVSRGVGTTGLPVRFRVPPEIAVITLTSGGSSSEAA